MTESKKFNIIGFFNRDQRYKWQGDGWVLPEPKIYCCKFHPGTPLIPKQDEKGMLQCPECGSPFPDPDYKPIFTEDEQMKGKHEKQQTKIISGGKKKKKFYDSLGNEINDPDLIVDVKQGKNVISYSEVKSGTDKPVVVKK